MLRHFFLIGRVISFRRREWGMQEKDGARRGLRHDGGRMRRVEGGKMERERVVGKPAGDERVFIPWPRGQAGR